MNENKEFTTEELITNLDQVINAHRNDTVSPFDTNWVGMLIIARTKIIELDRDLRMAIGAAEDLKDCLRIEQERNIAEAKKNEDLDLL